LPPGHEYKFLIANPKAFETKTRFVDYDLNRSFGSKSQVPSKTYEAQRAKEIKKEVESWSKGEPFFLIDLHTTTSNMKGTLVLSKRDRLSAWIAKQTHEEISQSHLLINSDMDEDCIFIESISQHGLIVEVGPVANNVLDARILEQTETLVGVILKHLLNAPNTIEKISITLKAFQEFKTIHFPKTFDSFFAKNLIGQDYRPLLPKQELFILSDGTKIQNPEDEVTYPVFINEAAYFKDNIACLLTRKVEFEI
jgi:aspartoacylase